MRVLKSSTSASSAKAVLEIEENQFPLHPGKMYLIGRKKVETNLNIDIALEGETVDSKHAVIDVCKDIVQIFDINSTSGTYLNGHRLDAMHRVNIKGVGTLRFGDVEGNLKVLESMESPNSSGFHEEPTASSSEITGLLNKSEHSFTMPAAVSRQNVSCNILATLNDSTDSNRTADSFSIPETQHFKARNSLNEKECNVDKSLCSNDNDSFIPETQEFVVSNTKTKCYEADNAAVEANLPPEIFSDDGETKDSTDSQFRICTQMFNDDCFGEEIDGNDNNFLQSSVVIPRIQHVPVVLSVSETVPNVSRDDSKDKDLNNIDDAEMDALNWTENTSKCTTLDDGRDDACTPDLFDLPDFARDIAKKTKHAATSDKSCTSNDKTGTDTASDMLETQIFISTDVCTSENADKNVSTTRTTQSDLSVPKQLYEPSILDGDDYDLMPTQIFPHAVTAAAARQQDDDASVPVYLTLSDKENMQPTAVMLTDSEKLEKTQLFVCPPKSVDSNLSKSTATTSSKAQDENSDDKSLIANKSVSDIASTSKKNNLSVDATHTAEASLLCNDDDLMPTQIFPHAAACTSKSLYNSKSKSVTTTTSSSEKNNSNVNALHTEENPLLCNDDDDLMPTQIFPHAAAYSSKTLCSIKPKSVTTTSLSATSSKNCLNSTLLSVDGHNRIKSAVSFFDEIEKTPDKSTIQANDSGEFKKPKPQNKTSSSLASSQPDEDVDLQMCTPQLIQHEFMQLKEQTKHSVIAAKQRSLFGGNSDEEEQDVLKLINAPQKQSNDFDKLVPHLKVDPATPTKKEDNEKKSRSNYNTFKIDLKVDNKTTRSRDQRHVARDKDRAGNGGGEQKIAKKSKSETKKESAKDNEKAAPPQSVPAKRLTGARSIVDEADLKIAANNAVEKKDISETKDTDKTSSRLDKSSKRLQSGSSTSKDKERDEASTGEKLSRLRSCAELDSATIAVESIEKKDTDQIPKHMQKSSKRISSRTKSKEIESERKETRKRSCNDLDVADTEKDADKISTRNKKSGKGSESLASSSKEKEAEASTAKRTRLRTVANIDLTTVVIDLTEDKNTDAPKKMRKTKVQKQVENKSTELEKKRVTRARSNTESQESNSSSSTSLRASTSKQQQKRQMETEDATKIKRMRRLTSVDESITSSIKSTGKIQVSMTMVDPELFQKLSENAGDIWSIAKDPIDSDVLIMDKGNRTFKFLIAMAKGIPIVTSKWLECLNRNKTVPTNNAELFFTDPAFEKRHKFLLLKSLEMARKHKLFAGYDFLMTPNIQPQPSELKAIIDCAGGTVHAEKTPPFKNNQKIYLISNSQDKQHWHKYRRLNNNIRIIGTEGVMASVMRQLVKPLDSYLLG